MVANQTANFVVKAKDAATGPLGKVGSSMGKLRRTAGTVFKAIAGAAAVAAGAIAAFTADAIRGAVDDERSTILLNAALKARGFQLDKLTPKIEEQIEAARKFGIADDRVRAGLEVGSRFFKNQTKLLKANELATAISAVTGEDLETVMGKIGKAANGSTKGLAALIGPIDKGAKFTDIYTQGMEKFEGIADELANSTSGKFLSAQEEFNEAMDEFGTQFLPVVNEVLTFLTEKALPAFKEFLDEIGPIITELVDEYVRPLVDSVAELATEFEKASGGVSLLEVALLPLKVVLGLVKALVDGIVAGLKFMQGFGGAAAMAAGSAARDYQTGGYARGDMGGQSSYLNTSQGLGTYVIPVSIGTGKVDTVVADSIRRIGPAPRRGR